MSYGHLKTLHRKTTILLWLLNVSDLAFTLFFIGQNWATEANPWLLFFFNKSVWAFVAAKMSVSSLGAYVLYKYPHKDVAVLGAMFLCGIYTALFFAQAFMAITGLLGE